MIVRGSSLTEHAEQRTVPAIVRWATIICRSYYKAYVHNSTLHLLAKSFRHHRVPLILELLNLCDEMPTNVSTVNSSELNEFGLPMVKFIAKVSIYRKH